jgi:hypothetical protein
MPVIEKFTTCGGCPAPISCDIRSACDRAPPERTTEELLAEITGLRVRQKQLQDELAAANGSLIASREEARQLRAGIDRMEAMKDYATTKAFHDEQARAASAPAVEFDITEQEDEAFKALEQRLTRVENVWLTQHGRINTLADKLDAVRAAL